jgi:MuDR family transposase
MPFVCSFNTIPIVATMLAIGDKFPNIQEAREAINRSVLNDGESYKVYKSDSKRHIVQCKDKSCTFSIRAAFSKKTGVSITKISSHSCRPTVHYENKQSSSLWFLKEHHRAMVLDNRNITAKQIQSDERLRYNNRISYRQALRVVRTLFSIEICILIKS